MDSVLLLIETAAMWLLVCWSIRRSPFMEYGRTPLVDILAVSAIGGGALEHALYNIGTAVAPSMIVEHFSTVDRWAMVALWVGVASWIGMPMLRKWKAA